MLTQNFRSDSHARPNASFVATAAIATVGCRDLVGSVQRDTRIVERFRLKVFERAENSAVRRYSFSQPSDSSRPALSTTPSWRAARAYVDTFFMIAPSWVRNRSVRW